MIDKRSWKIIIITFIIFAVLFTAISYKDQRYSDGALTIGYPIPFYGQSSGFIDKSVAYFSITYFIVNLVLYFVAAISVNFAIHKFRK